MLIRIVDDDEDLAESLKFLLEPEGWEVVSYPSAEDYLKSDAPSVEGCLPVSYTHLTLPTKA